MAIEVVNQDTVLKRALDVIGAAHRRVWITSPWITQYPVSLLLREILPRVAAGGGLDVRIVYRVKEPEDLEITDLDALKSFETAGCSVRYSTRLHSEVVLADDAAIVPSSNLTATVGYLGGADRARRNQELSILTSIDERALADLETQFEAVWSAAISVDEATIGIVMDCATVRRFSFVAIRDVRLGGYATTHDAGGNMTVGRIAEVTAYNRSFPRRSERMWLTQGNPAGGDSRVATQVRDRQSFFSYPSNEHEFLVMKTCVEPQSVFRIAQVEVLKHYRNGQLTAPSAPASPGMDVSQASPYVLRRLFGDGDLELGTVPHHPEIAVFLRGPEILSKHLAVFGMTGSGKSNALKVLLRSLAAHPAYCGIRVVVVDTHGEYAPAVAGIAPGVKALEVRLRRSILDPDVMKQLLSLSRHDMALARTVRGISRNMEDGAGLDRLAAELESEAADNPILADKLFRLAQAATNTPDLCLWPGDAAVIVASVGHLDEPGFHHLDLRTSATFEERSAKAAAVMRHVFEHAKQSGGALQSLIILDEAQNYVPEQQTGRLSRARDCFDAALDIASEGRKFNVGLVLSSQRPDRINKDILSQCNTQMVFRVANAEDLAAIARTFEAASQPLLAELPGFDTGVCVVGGPAIGMLTCVQLPLLDDVPHPDGTRMPDTAPPSAGISLQRPMPVNRSRR